MMLDKLLVRLAVQVIMACQVVRNRTLSVMTVFVNTLS
jgi:hypothetical protein